MGKIRMVIPYHMMCKVYTTSCKNLDASRVPFILSPVDLVHDQDRPDDGFHLLRLTGDDVEGPPFYPMIIDEPVDHFRGILMRHPM